MTVKKYVCQADKVQIDRKDREVFLRELKRVVIISLGEAGYLSKKEVGECIDRLRRK